MPPVLSPVVARLPAEKGEFEPPTATPAMIPGDTAASSPVAPLQSCQVTPGEPRDAWGSTTWLAPYTDVQIRQVWTGESAAPGLLLASPPNGLASAPVVSGWL